MSWTKICVIAFDVGSRFLSSTRAPTVLMRSKHLAFTLDKSNSFSCDILERSSGVTDSVTSASLETTFLVGISTREANLLIISGKLIFPTISPPNNIYWSSALIFLMQKNDIRGRSGSLLNDNVFLFDEYKIIQK